MKILYALRPQTFDKELKLSTERAAAVTCLYDIPLMFEKLKKRPRLKGGLKTASDILEDDCDCTNNTPRYYKINREIDSIKKNQRLLASVGALLWLSFHRTNILTPVPISRKLFATKLLRQASNAKELRRVVSDYHAVRSRLILRGYRLPALKLKIELPPSTITFKTMPEELLHGVI